METRLLQGAMLVAVLHCGGSGSVTATAGFIMGASTAPSSSRAHMTARPSSAALANGSWVLTPNQAKVTIQSIQLANATDASQANLTGCTITYDSTKPSGTDLTDCPVAFQAGSYFLVTVIMAGDFQILVSDDTNGIYTDASSGTGLSTTKPAGGATFVRVNAGGFGAGQNQVESTQVLVTPLTIAQGQTPKFAIITDMIHTTRINVSSGSLQFQPFDGSNPPVYLAATLDGGRSEFYSTVTTAANAANNGTEEAARVFYNGQGQPVWVYSRTPACGIGPVSSGRCDAYASGIQSVPKQNWVYGGYLGLDSSGTLAWASASDMNWTGYLGLFEMARVTTVGSSTTLKFKATTNPPAPSSGTTYASGAPPITPGSTYPLTLLAR